MSSAQGLLLHVAVLLASAPLLIQPVQSVKHPKWHLNEGIGSSSWLEELSGRLTSGQRNTVSGWDHAASEQLSNCAESALQGLNALYWATGGETWSQDSRDGWNKTKQCCSWNGVACESSGQVTKLSLIHSNLTGDIPEEFAASESLQQSLTVLMLGENRIKSLPENIGLLSNLLFLEINDNGGSLNLPESLGDTSLVYLRIGNGTEHPPYEGTRLVTIPDSLASLKRLRVLDLNHNSLTGQLNPDILNLPDLEVIDFSLGQVMIDFPGNGFSKLRKLRHLALDYNVLVELPDNIHQAKKLEYFSVSPEPGVFHGKLPESIGQLTNLTYLSFTGNYNAQAPIPSSIWNITSLQYMDISYNSIAGSWPETFEQHGNLTYLEMGAMMFGHLPDILGQLTNLTHFGIRTNQLTGPIPESLGSLSKLKFFNVAGNGLNGTIPGSLKSFLPGLVEYSCQMDSNDFSCPIPSFVPSYCGATCSPVK
ncbi:uncharacterized protein LOC135809113 [Sycon ciliatum]|uniref:uncharacterized protein LOC135809113 n=1 Tax=Sycon ciliatum TaxID=27933 RepID=UPI0020A9D376|eukprot:scpid73161/ scgid10392/ Leucine-rich repeat receptor-like protein kinase TDR; Protein PHLOEM INTERCALATED WITH XYLEM; Tracheary element differentiation inhibitory factor receptor